MIPGTTGHDRRAIGDHLDARRGEPLDVEAFFDTMRVYFRPRGEARGEDRRTCRKEERTPVASPASPASEAIAAVKGPSQEDMCAVWAPRILRDGRRARKTAFAYCRPAVLGEAFECVVGGKVETRCEAKDASSFVVRAATSDAEMYIITRQQFDASYLLPGKVPGKDVHAGVRSEDEGGGEKGRGGGGGGGVDLDLDAAALALLAAEGFRRYDSKRQVVAMRVMEDEDLAYFPDGHFMAAWGEWMRVEKGDCLVTSEGGGEVYRIENRVFSETYAWVADEGKAG